MRSRRWLPAWTIIILTIGIAGPARAQLALNFTQSGYNGINISDLQTSLETGSGMSLLVKSDRKNMFKADYDVISLDSSQAEEACDKGKLLDLDNIDGFGDYLENQHYIFNHNSDCAVSYASFSLVIAYPLLNLVTTHPASPADLFDIEQFPGTRALPDSPVGTLEWALLSYGIPMNEVYQLLSTERGMNLAFKRLDKIRRHIIWWKDVDDLKSLLANKQVVMAAGPHTAFYEVQFSHPMEIVWNGQLQIDMKLGVNTASSQQSRALELIKRVMSDEVQFELAYQFAFGPASKSTLKRLTMLPQSGQLMPFVPTHRATRKTAVWLNHNWHRQLEHKIGNRFRQWRQAN